MSSDDNQYRQFQDAGKDSVYKALQSAKKTELLKETEKLRGSILDSAQLFFADHKNWKLFRARVLTLLGVRGFERTISETFEKPFLSNRTGDL